MTWFNKSTSELYISNSTAKRLLLIKRYFLNKEKNGVNLFAIMLCYTSLLEEGKDGPVTASADMSSPVDAELAAFIDKIKAVDNHTHVNTTTFCSGATRPRSARIPLGTLRLDWHHQCAESAQDCTQRG